MAFNGRASGQLWSRAPWRSFHRAPRESSWLLPDGQQGRPTEGRDSFRDRPRASLPRETPTARTRGTVLRGRSCRWSRRIPRQGTSRMPVTLNPITSAMLWRDSSCSHAWAARRPETVSRTTGCVNRTNRPDCVRDVYRAQTLTMSSPTGVLLRLTSSQPGVRHNRSRGCNHLDAHRTLSRDAWPRVDVRLIAVSFIRRRHKLRRSIDEWMAMSLLVRIPSTNSLPVANSADNSYRGYPKILRSHPSVFSYERT